MNQQSVSRSEAGMSLVELMFGIVVIALFVGSLLTMSIRQGKHRRINLENSLAMTAALDNLERVRNTPFANMPSVDGQDFDVKGVNGTSGGLRPLASDPDGYPGELSVSVDQTSGGNTLYRVVATVEWRGVTSARRLQLETLIAERK